MTLTTEGNSVFIYIVIAEGVFGEMWQGMSSRKVMGKGLRPREYSSRNRDCLSLIFITAASNSYLPFSVRWSLMQADNTALPSAPIRPPHDSPTSPKNLAGNTLVLFSSTPRQD